jgi:hypothetical protein
MSRVTVSIPNKLEGELKEFAAALPGHLTDLLTH